MTIYYVHTIDIDTGIDSYGKVCCNIVNNLGIEHALRVVVGCHFQEVEWQHVDIVTPQCRRLHGKVQNTNRLIDITEVHEKNI